MRDHLALDRRLTEALTRFVRYAQFTRLREGRKAFFDTRPPPIAPNFPVVDFDIHFALQMPFADLLVHTRLGWRAASPLLENPPHSLEKVCKTLSSPITFIVCHETEFLECNLRIPRVEHRFEHVE